MTMTDTTPLLTTAQVCDQIGIHRNTLRRYVTLGMITPIQINQRTIRWHPDDIAQLLDRRMSDMQAIIAAHQLLAEEHATEERPLCSNCGKRRVNRGHSFCLWCEQLIEAQLEHKRRYWNKKKTALNEAKRRSRAQRRQTTTMTSPDQDNPDQPEQPDTTSQPTDQPTTQPTRRLPMRTTVPPRQTQ